MGILSFFKKDKKQEQNKQKVQYPPREQETINIPAFIDGQKCVYQYKKIDINLADNVDLEKIIGQRVQIDTSRGVVSLFVGDQYIGTMGTGKLADMVFDWTNRGEPMFAVITQTDDERYFAAFDLFFYRDEMKYLLYRYPNAKKYKLIGNRRESMQDNIIYCERGNECSVQYDIDKDKYLVTAFSEIGYLPAAAAKIASEHGEDNLSVFIADVSPDEEGIDEVSVYIFPKKR